MTLATGLKVESSMVMIKGYGHWAIYYVNGRTQNESINTYLCV